MSGGVGRHAWSIRLAGAALLAGLAALAAACSTSRPAPLAEWSPAVLTTAGGVQVDARGRFREIFCALAAAGATRASDTTCEETVVRLADEPPPTGRPVVRGAPVRPLRVVVVPGYLGDCFRRFATTFGDALPHLERQGYRTAGVRVSGLGGTQHNARQLREGLRALTLDADERLVLVGHSKGAADILQMLADFPDVVPSVAAVIAVAGPVAGSPLADEMPWVYRPLLGLVRLLPCDAGDGRALESLRPSERRAFLAREPLPPSVEYVSVGGVPGPAQVSRVLKPGYRELATVDPRNDGQVIWSDTVVPGGVIAGFVRADHWAIALPLRSLVMRTLADHNDFPRAVLLEALVRLVEERLVERPR